MKRREWIKRGRKGGGAGVVGKEGVSRWEADEREETEKKVESGGRDWGGWKCGNEK